MTRGLGHQSPEVFTWLPHRWQARPGGLTRSPSALPGLSPCSFITVTEPLASLTFVSLSVLFLQPFCTTSPHDLNVAGPALLCPPASHSTYHPEQPRSLPKPQEQTGALGLEVLAVIRALVTSCSHLKVNWGLLRRVGRWHLCVSHPSKALSPARSLLNFRMSLHESSLPSWATSSQTNVISFLLLGSQVQSPRLTLGSHDFSPLVHYQVLYPTSTSLRMRQRFLLPQPELAQASLSQVSLPPLWPPPPVHPPFGIQRYLSHEIFPHPFPAQNSTYLLRLHLRTQ